MDSISQSTIITAKRKCALTALDKVVTGEQARAQFSFAGGTLTTRGADSEMSIQQYNWLKGAVEPEAEFTVVKGVFRTVTGLITNVDDPKFKVQTPMGRIGIRGTDFWGGYVDKDAIDVLFVEGEHTIEVSNEFGTVILEKPGQGTTITAGKAPSTPKTWPKAKVQRAVKTITID